MSISMIAALDQDLAIGKGNAMPWHLSDDLKRFKKLTLGKPILMGYNTALAIGSTLPARTNLVLSRNHDAPYAGQQTARTLEEAQILAGDQDLVIVGGGEIYRLALPLARTLHLTWVDTRIEAADVWFPEYEPDHWRELAREHHPVDAKHAYAFDWVDYVRV